MTISYGENRNDQKYLRVITFVSTSCAENVAGAQKKRAKMKSYDKIWEEIS